jgi:hypothetical protein
MKMKAIREWWRRTDDVMRQCAAAAEWDPLEDFDRRLRRVEKAVEPTQPGGGEEARSHDPVGLTSQSQGAAGARQ